MTIDTSYYSLNRNLNTNYMSNGLNFAAYNNVYTSNPFILNMQIQANILAAKYRQMFEITRQLQEQAALAMKNNTNTNFQTYSTPFFNYDISSGANKTNLTTNSIWKPNATNSTTSTNKLNFTNTSYSNISLDDSDLKPGLFKGRLAGQEALVTRLCRKYNVNPGLVAAIIGLESGWGTSNLAMHNNFGGLKKAGDLGANEKGFGYFSTIEKGLEAMIANLAKYPQRYSDVKAVDFNNLDAIGRHYCDASWAPKIREVYSKNVKSYLA